MKDALIKVLAQTSGDDSSVDRIMAASFFRNKATRLGGQPSTIATVICLDERRANAGR